MKTGLITITILAGLILSGAEQEVSIHSTDVDLYGTLLTPEVASKTVVLLISGSGQTDRNGNSGPGYINDCLRKVAEELTGHGYATLRYDKRGVGKSRSGKLTPESLRFEHFVADAENWILYLKQKFDTVIVAGHSEGGLVGMMAARTAEADLFISIAGLNEDAHTTVKRQLSTQPKFVTDVANPILDSLRAGVKTDSVPAYLNSLLSPRIQDYFISFMQVDPKEEIQKLNIPILLIQGTTDLQITVEGAQELEKFNKMAELVILDSMNHILRKVGPLPGLNMVTYNKSDMALHEGLIPEIVRFIQGNN